jgi:hypothetical protein
MRVGGHVVQERDCRFLWDCGLLVGTRQVTIAGAWRTSRCADARCLREGGRVAAGQPNASSGASASASKSIRWYFLATCSWCSPSSPPEAPECRPFGARSWLGGNPRSGWLCRWAAAARPPVQPARRPTAPTGSARSGGWSLRWVGWQPSRFLADRAGAERAFRLASGWAASTPPLKSWAPPGPRCAKPSTGMASGCRPATPRRSASALPRPRASAAGGRPPRAWTRCLWRSTTASSRSGRARGELAERVRRAEDYAALGAEVVELHTESHASKPSTRVWAITRRADRGHRVADQRTSRSGRRQTERAARTDRSSRPYARPEERELAADTR